MTPPAPTTSAKRCSTPAAITASWPAATLPPPSPPATIWMPGAAPAATATSATICPTS